MAEPRRLRCAIYTRKSSDEGLDQAFNSLDAQREACAAYIASQRHEGWSLVPDLYDDGGYSGGSMERPGLKQLLADIKANKVDVIVVYKVDRLTRSLADFAKMVELFDVHQVSFVSVTQSFNTTTSMGRLTLNVLLSFAQFEREVTGERIRDKIAASKAKGMWMGGPVPLGYRVETRKLVIDDAEAATVRHIFGRYAELGTIDRTVDDLAASGFRTKRRLYKDGRVVGGIAFSKGPLAYLLQNRVYIGEVVHKGTVHAGEHASIIDHGLWTRVQEQLAANRVARKLGRNAKAPSLLVGLLYDPAGRPMGPSHAVRDGKRYRYYHTRRMPGDGLKRRDIVRIPAGDIERLVIERIANWLQDTSSTHFDGSESADAAAERTGDRRRLAARLPSLATCEQRAVLIDHAVRVELGEAEARITLHDPAAPASDEQGRVELTVPARLTDRGSDIRLAIAPDAGAPVRTPDPVLVRLLAQAFMVREGVANGKSNAAVSHYSLEHQRKLLRLSWLAPDIVTAIIDGRQPPGLTGRRLLRAGNLPVEWQAQRRLFGFA